MKKTFLIILLCSIVSALFVGCENQTVAQGQTSQMLAIGNPWSEWRSIEEAEAATGFSFALPAVIANRYNAVEFRTMNNELIEVIYRDEDSEICIRKQEGAGQDISGDYNKYDSCTETNHNGVTVTNYHNSNNPAVKQIISHGNYSWSLVAPNGYHGDSNQDFLNKISEQ